MKERLDRRGFIREAITLGAGVLGVAAGKAIADAQYSATQEKIQELEGRQTRMEQELSLQVKDQQRTNSDLFQGLFGLKEEINK